MSFQPDSNNAASFRNNGKTQQFNRLNKACSDRVVLTAVTIILGKSIPSA